MLSKQDYLDQLLKELDSIIKRGRRSLYRINDDVTEDTINYITNYFLENNKYEIVTKKCLLYENSYDVMIMLKD